MTELDKIKLEFWKHIEKTKMNLLRDTTRTILQDASNNVTVSGQKGIN